MKIGVVDYGVGNITNVIRCLTYITQHSVILRVSQADEIQQCDKLLLPGVGAFGSAIENLKAKNLDVAIHDFASSGRYVLGICLGMQLLFEISHEFGIHKGLGLIHGNIVRFGEEYAAKSHNTNDQNFPEIQTNQYRYITTSDTQYSNHLKIPHIGWNKNFKRCTHSLFTNISDDFFLYFVHSYHAVCDERNILATCEYGVSFPSIVCKDNILGIQAHPERSHNVGFQIMQNFINL